MSTAGFGRIYQPTYRDKHTGARRASAVWWIEFWTRGVQHRESSHSRKRRDAEGLLKRRIGEIASGRFVGPAADRVTFADLEQMLTDDYTVNGRRSLRRARASLAQLRQRFGDLRAVDITGDRVARYVADRLAASAAPATAQNELAALRRAFTLAVRAGRLTAGHVPYIPTIEVRNTRTGFLEDADFRAVLAELPADVQPVAEFMYWTGWRTSEALTLEWNQVDFRSGVVRLEPGTTKNDEARELPFAVLPELESLLRRQRERTDAVERARDRLVPWVFHREGERIKDFLGAWHSACRRAGLVVTSERDGETVTRSAFIPHDFRRSTVRRYERAGVPRSVAMRLTGHKTESVYRRYAIVSRTDLQEAMVKVAALTAAEQAQPRPRTVTPILMRARKVPAKSVRLDGQTAADLASVNA